jgi:hypothetical protein
MRLVIHDGEKGISNFAKVLEEVVAEGPIAVATPYLKPEYLAHLVNGKEWRLLTDLNECLGSMNTRECAQFHRLFVDDADKIKHYPLLHAKVVIGRRKAFIGSANLTESGLGRREEVSVLIDDQGVVGELLAWFDRLWRQAYKPKIKEIKTCWAKLSRHQGTKRPKKSFRSKVSDTSYKIPWKQKLEYKQADIPEVTRRDHLMATIALAPSKEWIDDYCELMKEAIDVTGLASEDPRIVTTCPKEKTIRLNINNRLVLSAYYEDYSAVGFILPRDFTFDSELERRIIKYNPDDSFRPITKNENIETTPIFVSFKVSRMRDIPAYVIELWKEEVVREVGLRKRSPYKDHHEPLVYRAAMDNAFRKRLVDEAFGG